MLFYHNILFEMVTGSGGTGAGKMETLDKFSRVLNVLQKHIQTCIIAPKLLTFSQSLYCCGSTYTELYSQTFITEGTY